MSASLRLSALRDRLVGALWFWPAVSIVVAIVAADLLARVEPAVGGLARFGGTPEGARATDGAASGWPGSNPRTTRNRPADAASTVGRPPTS